MKLPKVPGKTVGGMALYYWFSGLVKDGDHLEVIITASFGENLEPILSQKQAVARRYVCDDGKMEKCRGGLEFLVEKFDALQQGSF